MAISPQRKQRIRRQERRAASRAAQPELAAIRRGKKSVRRQYRSGMASAQGAVATEERYLSQAIRDARKSGLEGRYLHDVVSELAARKADAPQMLNSLGSQLRQDKREGLMELRDAAADTRASAQESATSAIAERLQAIRERKQARLEEAKTTRQDRTRSTKNASIIAQNLLEDDQDLVATELPPLPEDASDSDREDYAEQQAAIQRTRAFLNDLYSGKASALRHLAAAVADKAEGVDEGEALAVVRRMFQGREDDNPYAPGLIGRTLQSLGG